MSLLTCSRVNKTYQSGRVGRSRKQLRNHQSPGANTGARTVALREFSMSVETGEITAVMGPSGSGKTTLLNLIATIDRPTSGSIIFEGTEITSLSGRALAAFRRDRLGFVFQDANLLDTLTVRENIVLPLALRGDDRTSMDETVSRLTTLLGIEEILEKYPMETSGGQRQRAAVARALSTDPGMILADEPTGSLDSRNTREIMEYLLELQNSRGATVLLVTHDPLVASYCRRVVFIRDGALFSEIRRNNGRSEFYARVVDVLTALEGAHETI